MKRGFSLLELLFIFGIIAALTGYAINQFTKTTDIALLNSMKHDAKNAILTQQALYSNIQAFDDAEGYGSNHSVAPKYGSASGKGDNKGILYGTNGTIFYLTKDNYLFTESYMCDNGLLGFEVQLQNDKANDFIYFDSCDNGVMQVLN
jgi:type II secretory pathway pseudopilin PulG